MGDAPTFAPKKVTRANRRHVGMRFTDDEYYQIKCAAKVNGLSIKEFCRQGVLFALTNLAPTNEVPNDNART